MNLLEKLEVQTAVIIFLRMCINMNNKQLVVQFWGVRGTLPVSGENSLRYGGNTNCVTLKIADDLFIFDAGIGIKKLGDHLVKSTSDNIHARVFISHPHWDHISGLPYFAPFYAAGNKFDIYSPCDEHTSVKELLFGQMDTVHFPVRPKQMLAKFKYHKLKEGTYDIDDVHIKTIKLNHPGICLGYRIEYNNKSFCYITDNELRLSNSKDFDLKSVEHLIDFISGTDLLIIDSTYTDEEYLKKISWGHSAISQVADVADKGKVKLLCLFHHDPCQNDDAIDLKLQTVQKLLNSRQSITQCIAPREGDTLII